MRKIAVVTTTRAEYGLLSPVITELRKYESDELKIDLIVTGTHLSKEYGMTISEIDERIDWKIPISVNSCSEADISSNQADALVKFTKLFIHERYNAVILLGDRYETLAIAIAAGNTLTAVFHLCGGDTTEGAIDEWIRHSITKISYLHFVTNEDSRKRVIQLGESPSRVFNFGSTSIDNIIACNTANKAEALHSIQMPDCYYALCTYHPVTMEYNTAEEMIRSFLKAVNSFPNIEFIVTLSNSDLGGTKINELLYRAEECVKNLHVYTSLGMKRYLSLMKFALFVLGNSSSGIIEAPALHIPSVNIGDRQKGRLHSDSVINCDTDANSIINGINIALSDKHISLCKNSPSLYGSGNASVQIAAKSISTVIEGQIYLKKPFYKIL